jgi:outer membrane protein OmpA-like peptidoglycan-associated protein
MQALRILFLLLVATNLVTAQSSFVPANVGATTVNSPFDDINPVLTPDGKTLFFTRVNHPQNTFGVEDSEDIWTSTLQGDGSWSTAVRIPNLNIGRYNAVLSVSADGKTLLLNGVYNKKGNIWKKRGLSTSFKIGDGWSTPEKLNVSKLSKRNRGMKSSASMQEDGKQIVYSFSRTYNSEKTNLFLSQKKENGKWRRPIPIRSLNSKYNEEAPFLTADGKTLYFSSDRKEKGQFDIYKSTFTDGKWTQAKALSDTINSNEWDSYLKTNTKGSIAYFSSAREGKANADIYKVKLFEENPFVIVSGEIRNAVSNKPLIGKQARILVNGQPAGARVNPDSATYSIKLPLRKTYVLTVDVPNFTGQPYTVDVLNVREFTKLDQDLKAKPLPYTQVHGNLLVEGKREKIPASANPRIFINNVPSDSAQVNAADGTYSVRLKHGAAYILQVKGNRYEPVPKKLDLTYADEYQDTTIDLTASTERMAWITGNIIDKKTSQHVKSSKVKINVEGMTSASATIDTVNGKYELFVPFGKIYTISASVPNYYPVYETADALARTDDPIFRDLIIVPIEVGQSIRLNNIFFQTGKSVLKKESFPELNRVAEFLKSNPDIKIEIAGHTDNVGKAATNLKLSQARAKAVTDYVISKGIAKTRIVAKGYGMTKPVADNKTKEGKAQNRRVEFTILDK